MLLLDSVCGMISVVLEVHGPDLRVAVLVLPILVDVVVPPTRIVV